MPIATTRSTMDRMATRTTPSAPRQLVGQFIGNADVAKRLLDRAGGRGVHAYLLTGPAGVGKRTLAEQFAAALLCERASEGKTARGACGECKSCLLHAAGNHPDYHALPADEKLTIAMVRELSAALDLAPHSGRHQVGLIPNADRLAVPAQNALLKLLEEPPRRAVLILTAPSPASLLPTTVSRCQRVPLGPVPVPEIAKGLKERGVSQAEDVANRSAERPGRAIQLAEQPEVAEAVAADEQTLLDILQAPVPERLSIAKRLADEPDQLSERLDTWIATYRSSLREGEGRLDGLVPLAKRIDGLVRLFAARRQLRYNPNTQLLLERLTLNL